jgi:integrase
VPISAEFEADLREYAKGLDDPKAFLFPGRTGKPMISENYLRRRLKPLALKAGIKDITFQALRRTVGTHMQDHGTVKRAQTLLRHGSADTTMKHYQKRIPKSVKDAVDSWDGALRKTKRRKSSSKTDSE